MNAIVSAAVLALLTVTTVLLSVPQLVRLVRTGDPSGLSPTSLLFGAANYTAWNVYLVQAGAWGILVANALATLVWFSICGLALPQLRPSRSWWLPTAWAAGLLGVVLVAPVLLGPLLGLGSLLTYTPQAVGVWRAVSLAGISPATWSLTAVEGLVWLGQSLQDGLVGGVLSGLITLAAATSVLTALVWTNVEPVPAGC